MRRRPRSTSQAVALIVALTVIALLAAARNAEADSSPAPCAFVIGVPCNYAAADIGGPHVPDVSPLDRRAIARVVASLPEAQRKYVRFAYAGPEGTSQRQLIIYNGGPNGATGAVPGQPDASASFPALNVPGGNLMYDPRRNVTFAAPPS